MKPRVAPRPVRRPARAPRPHRAGSARPGDKGGAMHCRISIVGGALAAVVLAATTLTAEAAQESSTTSGSTEVQQVEPFTPLTDLRIPPLDQSTWTEAHREVAGPQGGPAQIQICLHNLELCRKYWTFTRQLTSHYTLPLRDKELLILRTAWLSRGNYIWGRHSTGSGRRAGAHRRGAHTDNRGTRCKRVERLRCGAAPGGGRAACEPLHHGRNLGVAGRAV